MNVDKEINMKKSFKILLIISIMAQLLFASVSLYYNVRLIIGKWSDMSGTELKFYPGNVWSYRYRCPEGCCNDARGNSDICPFYFVVGDKIITYGVGVDIIDIDDLSVDKLMIKIHGEKRKFINLRSDILESRYEGEDKRIFDLLRSGEWRSTNRPAVIEFNDYKMDAYDFLNLSGDFYYEYLGGGLLEVEFEEGEPEKMTIIEISEEKLIINARGVEIKFVKKK